MYESHYYRHISNPFERCMKRDLDITAFWIRQFNRCGFRLTNIFKSGIHTIALMIMVALTAMVIKESISLPTHRVEVLFFSIVLIILIGTISAHVITLHVKNGIDTVVGISNDHGYEFIPEAVKVEAIKLYLAKKAIKELGDGAIISSLRDGSFEQVVKERAMALQPLLLDKEKHSAVEELLSIATDHRKFLLSFLWAIEAIALSTGVIALI